MDDPRETRYCRSCDAQTERYSNGECAPCRRAISRRYYERNAAKLRDQQRRWRLENPEAHKLQLADWRANNVEHRADYIKQWRADNAEHVREYNAAWHEAHPEANVANVRRWAAENPEKARELKRAGTTRRRARKRGAIADDHTPQEIFARDNGKCQLSLHPDCRGVLDISRSREWNIDHVQPISRGGSHTRDNVQLTCDRCNRSKGARTMDEIMERRHST